jgi:nucleoside-diphosphate-sugar epimerase
MKVLVTGATGFVGSHLVEALLRRGEEVTALVRSPQKAHRLAQLGVRQVAGDLRHPGAVAEAVKEQDVIYHVAGLIAARSSREFYQANREATAALVRQAEAVPSPPRFVLVSSLAAAGPAAPGQPLTGAEPPRPVTEYGRSKLAGEEVVRASGLDWRIIRPPMVYGPRDVEIFRIFRLAARGIVPLFGDGSQELSAIYGPDLAEALVAAATAPAGARRAFYACHPEVFTSRQLVLAVAEALGRPVRIVPLPTALGRAALAVSGALARLAGRATILTLDKANEFFQPAWTADPGPLARETGWSARYALRPGLAETAAWYQARGWI